MNEFAEKKADRKLVEELLKKHPSLKHAHSLSMSEGPMLIDETKGIEVRARQQFEKSVKIELSEIKRLRKLVRRYKKRKGRLREIKGERKENRD
ncbi:TPA: hypothetical protein HA225_03085 [Candidatus Micrarchaeota archaeon]|nr:hypothetical protein [Candidatus Micrarchaeota archaeon]HIH30223.1 hypothetical protein [Candidatus Micrarchaeota archaeon]